MKLKGSAVILSSIKPGEGFYAYSATRTANGLALAIRRPLYRMTESGPEVAITGLPIALPDVAYWRVMSPGVGLTWLWQLPDTHWAFRSGCLHDQECDFIGVDTTAADALRLFRMDMAYRAKSIWQRFEALSFAGIVKAHDILKYGKDGF